MKIADTVFHFSLSDEAIKIIDSSIEVTIADTKFDNFGIFGYGSPSEKFDLVLRDIESGDEHHFCGAEFMTVEHNINSQNQSIPIHFNVISKRFISWSDRCHDIRRKLKAAWA